jgi:hypothetical protein
MRCFGAFWRALDLERLRDDSNPLYCSGLVGEGCFGDLKVWAEYISVSHYTTAFNKFITGCCAPREMMGGLILRPKIDTVLAIKVGMLAVSKGCLSYYLLTHCQCDRHMPNMNFHFTEFVSCQQ